MGYHSFKVRFSGWWKRRLHPLDERILVLGDSNSSRPDSYRCWPAILAKMLPDGIHVINDSFDGRTTGLDTKERNGCWCVHRRFAGYRPVDKVLIMLGTNDVKMRYGPATADEIERNFRMIAEAIAEHIEIGRSVLLLPPPIGAHLVEDFEHADGRIAQVCAVIRKLCAEMQIPLLDTHTALNVSRHFEPDAIHFNEHGRRAMAELVYNYLYHN